MASSVESLVERVLGELHRIVQTERSSDSRFSPAT